MRELLWSLLIRASLLAGLIFSVYFFGGLGLVLWCVGAIWCNVGGKTAPWNS